MSLRWINLERAVSDRHAPDRASLEINDRIPETLRVSGGLPHGARIRPEKRRDRDMLVEWLQSLQYNGDKPCIACDGFGDRFNRPCPACDGTGRIDERRAP